MDIQINRYMLSIWAQTVKKKTPEKEEQMIKALYIFISMVDSCTLDAVSLFPVFRLPHVDWITMELQLYLYLLCQPATIYEMYTICRIRLMYETP